MGTPDQFFCEPQFRAPQAQRICQVDRNNLLDWHRRDLVPDARSANGRGRRRRYSIHDLIYINTVRLLAAASMPLREVSQLADVVGAAFSQHWDGKPLDCLVVAHPECSGRWHYRSMQESDLREHIREVQAESAAVFDISLIVSALAKRIRLEMRAQSQTAA